MIDTHAHLYVDVFNEDIDTVIQRSKDSGVSKILLPAIDLATHSDLMALYAKYPDFLSPMMGVHPTNINKENINAELEAVKAYTEKEKFCAIGEIGLDLYWSQDYLKEQITALEYQMELALQLDLPISFHVRDAWPEMLEVLKRFRSRGVRGVMHSFAGDYQTYSKVKDLGEFAFGIGGVVTFKNGAIATVVPSMDLGDLVLETDAPYLTPVPYRGKRNESSYLRYIAEKIADLKELTTEEVILSTTTNAKKMFKL